MDAFDFITRIRQAGFTIELTDGNLAISPASELTDERRDWIRSHKPELVAALRSPGTILEADQAGNDLPPANDLVVVHVPELTLSTGQRISCDMTVPRANLERLRAVVRFTLKDNGGGGSLLGSPGKTEAELRKILREKYGDRLATIDGAEVRHG
jgi:hypothetical protein